MAVKYLIYGAGALGSIFGGLLQLSGQDVTYLGLGPHYEKILAHGIRITGIWGEFHVPKIRGFHTPEELQNEQFDAVLVCVKSTDTHLVASSAAKLAKSDGLVLSIQNGLNNVETLAKAAGNHRTIGGRIIFGADIPELGTAKVTVYADKVLLGCPFGKTNSALLEQITMDLNHAKIPTAIEPNIMAFIWGKVLYNGALNPLGAILEVPYGKLGEHPATKDLMHGILTEIFQVMAAKNIQVPYASADVYFTYLMEKQLPPTAEHRSSMLQDIKAGRKTEIMALNGAICGYGKELGIPTPLNEMITKLIQFKENLQNG
jgi:2-dehydropantoate 2-reductase